MDVKLLRGIIQGKERGLKKIIHTMLWVTGIVLTTVTLCVMIALTDIVLERKKEIALFKSLGAGNYKLVKIIVGESLFLGLVSGLAGYFSGLGLAQIVSQRSVGTGVQFSLLIFIASFLGTLGIAFLSTVFPLRKIIYIEPAKVLRGE